jgi:hypothetical protein
MYMNMYTIYTCVLMNLSIDFYVFPHTGGSRGTPFFRLDIFCPCFEMQIGFIHLVLLIGCH